jgi:cyclopropane fatty-acyl-phospholipid synthase-like methyltransferase
VGLNLERWLFELRYWLGRTPWDTQQTPPEVLAFLENHPSGRALDLGCGTGTNAITLAQYGWEVTGVDFSATAIWLARRKARRAGVDAHFRVEDVTDLSELEAPFDYALDIGCLHAVEIARRDAYVAGLERLVRSNGHYMLYAWLPRSWKDSTRGLNQEQVKTLFAPAFRVVRTEFGEERGSGSAWYWMRKR